jgi:hypothetical protein
VLAVRFSTLPTSTATGWYIAVLAGSASIGGLLAGVLAQTFGYSAILWMAAASFTTGLLVNVFGLWPAERKIRAEEAREGAVSTGEVAPALEYCHPTGFCCSEVNIALHRCCELSQL